MLIYYILIFYWAGTYVVLSANGALKDNKVSAASYTILAGLGLFLVMALRADSVGVDITQYRYLYERAQRFYGTNYASDEYSFFTMNYILSRMGVNWRLYLSLICGVICFSFSRFFMTYSANLFLSFYLHLTIGMFTMSMSGIRQTLAICIVLLAFYYMMEGKLVRYMLCVFLAYTFHNSALVFLPMYLFRNIKITKQKAYYLLIAVSSAVLIRKHFAILMEYVLPQRYQSYDLITDKYPINPLLILISILIPLACIAIWENSGRINKRLEGMFSILFVMALMNTFTNILSLNSNLIGRLSFYFASFNMIFIANAIESVTDRRLRFVAKVFCLMLPMIQFVMSTPDGTLQIDNYKFFFDMFY